ASRGQCEIDLRFQALTRMADQVMTYKYVVKNVARAAGKTVTFMPKPIFGDNGSGMHCHQSLWKEGTPLMADKSGYAGLSQLARGYVGGLLEPGAPADYDLFEESRGDVAQVPGSLGEALDALEADHEFLTKGGVFSDELIRTWIDYKRETEVDVVRLRPHPAEFSLYFDC